MPDFPALHAKIAATMGDASAGPIPASVFERQAAAAEAELNRHLTWAERMRGVDPVAASLNAKGPEEVAMIRRGIARSRKLAADSASRVEAQAKGVG